jgi:HAE1 family hydrophobic/amphiphilic exporter-1
MPWAERGPGQSVQALIGQLFGRVSTITEARVFPVNPPPIQGLGQFGGFQYQLQDRQGSLELDTLVQKMGEMLGAANQNPNLQNVFSTFSAATPQLLVEVDRDRAKSLDVDIDDLFGTLQTYLGSRYVTDYIQGQRTYRVYIQADQDFRSQPEDIEKLYVKSGGDQMIALSNLVTLTPAIGAQVINHYNLYRSIEITGSPAPGVSSGAALATMEQVSAQVLPPSMGYEWSGTSLEEIESGNQAPIIFGLGLVFVFSC